jgi:hypothetical protein
MGEPRHVLSSSGFSEPSAEKPTAEIRESLICELLFASRSLAKSNILGSHFFEIPNEPAGQVCAGCGMHTLNGVLAHLRSCVVGRVFSILDRMCDAQTSELQPEPAQQDQPGETAERKEDAQTLDPARADGLTPPRGVFGERWAAEPFRNHSSDCLMSVDGRFLANAAECGLPPEKREESASRIAVCVNFCRGIPTGLLAKEKPLADLTRDINHVTAVRRILPGLAVIR